MNFDYKTTGTCSRSINITIEDGIIKDVRFNGGCNGNAKGISKLVIGQNAKEIAKILKGTTCGSKSTSCPDQLANAIELALQKSE